MAHRRSRSRSPPRAEDDQPALRFFERHKRSAGFRDKFHPERASALLRSQYESAQRMQRRFVYDLREGSLLLPRLATKAPPRDAPEEVDKQEAEREAGELLKEEAAEEGEAAELKEEPAKEEDAKEEESKKEEAKEVKEEEVKEEEAKPAAEATAAEATFAAATGASATKPEGAEATKPSTLRPMGPSTLQLRPMEGAKYGFKLNELPACAFASMAPTLLCALAGEGGLQAVLVGDPIDRAQRLRLWALYSDDSEAHTAAVSLKQLPQLDELIGGSPTLEPGVPPPLREALEPQALARAHAASATPQAPRCKRHAIHTTLQAPRRMHHAANSTLQASRLKHPAASVTPQAPRCKQHAETLSEASPLR